jgi:hypothetical protein
MKIHARGWERDHGPKTLLDVVIMKVPIRDKIRTEEVGLKKTDLGMTIMWGGHYSLNGQYFMQLDFDKEDIARLFIEAFSNLNINEAISILHKAKKQLHANLRVNTD